MSEHELAFASVASLRVLLVPIQPIKRSIYDQHCSLIRKFTRIPLRDVPVDPRGPGAQLSAQPFQRGAVLFDFVDSYSKTQSYLEEFQISRRVVGVIGICQCDEWGQDLAEARREFERVCGQHPQLLASRCYAFEPPESQQDNVDGIVVVPSVGDLNFYMSTLLADFAASLLAELSTLASGLDVAPNASTPRDARLSAIVGANRPNPLRRSTLPELPPKFPSESQVPQHDPLQQQQDFRTSSATPPSHHPNRSSQRLSTFGDPSLASDKSTKRKMHARVTKLKADLKALAGRWEEAQTGYEESIATLKQVQDDVWHAAALEASVMLAVVQLWFNSIAEPPLLNTPDLSRSTGPGSRHSSSAQAPPFAPSALVAQVERLQGVVPLYQRALSLDPQQEDQCPPLLFTEACLRTAKALHAVWLCSGYNLTAVERLVAPRSVPVLPNSSFAQRTEGSKVTRAAISEAVCTGIGSHTLAVPVVDRIALCATAASIFSSLSFLRKRASVLREAVALVAEAVMQSQQPQSQQQSGVSANGSGFGSATSALVRAIAPADGNAALVHLLQVTASDFGLELLPPISADDAKEPIYAAAQLPEPFGWPEIQRSIVRDAILSTRMLSEYTATLNFATSALKHLYPALGFEEQYGLVREIPGLFGAARRRGLDAVLDCWLPSNVVVNLELRSLDKSRVLFEHPRSHADADAAKQSNKNPFIYNPKPKSNMDQVILVQHEIVDVLVTLRNPYLFELDISSLKLSTDGIAFEAVPTQVALAPGSMHTIRLSGYPLEPGILILRGVTLKLADCIEREFVVEAEPTNANVRDTRNSIASDAAERMKKSGLDVRQSLRLTSGQPSVTKFLECRVAPAQPLLRIASTSLAHGSLMLYDGESTKLEIAVENLSSLPVDLCRLAFRDNLSSAIEEQLLDNDVELSPIEAYELDLLLRRKPVMEWAQQPETFKIEAGASATLLIDCYGKYGCAEGAVTLDYASLGQSTDETTFFTRKLHCPINFTVHRAVDASKLELHPLRPLEGSREGSKSAGKPPRRSRSQTISRLDTSLESKLRSLEDSRYCLIVLGITNVFNRPFDVSVEGTQDLAGTDGFLTEQRVEAGATLNFLARLPRRRLAIDQVRQPIPAPKTARQYVVSARRNRMSSYDHEVERDMFWHREDLLTSIRASWKEIGSKRKGDVILRGTHFDQPMLDCFKLPLVQMSFTGGIVPTKSVPSGKPQSSLHAPLDDFILINLALHNSGEVDLYDLEAVLTVHTLTSSTSAASDGDLSDQVLIDGNSKTSIDVLPAQANHASTRSVMFLSTGRFLLNAALIDGLGHVIACQGTPVQVTDDAIN